MKLGPSRSSLTAASAAERAKACSARVHAAGTMNDGVERTSRFWGPVAKAEIRHPTDYVDIEVAIDLAVE